MSNSREFIDWLIELAQPAARVSSRAMFGGHGLYADGIIVAIVIDDVLYFKTDAQNRAEFVDLGLEPFVYASRNGEQTATSYHRAPDEAIETPAAMAQWLRSAMAAALRAAAAKLGRKKPRSPSAPMKRSG